MQDIDEPTCQTWYLYLLWCLRFRNAKKGQTDRRTWLNRLGYWSWSRIYTLLWDCHACFCLLRTFYCKNFIDTFVLF